ncbi:MAG: AmmeMemoRadiSam system protein B [Bdellovibrionales bacterium]|nr:AmmeMemoRadiSam system protein B [Bdellovibrionales bacterium]
MTSSLIPNHLLYPTLREPIEVRVENFEEKPVILMRCPMGITPAPLGLIPEVLPLLQVFNGRLSLEQIGAQLAHLGVTPEIAKNLAMLLDQHRFLEGPNFTKAKLEFEYAFRNLSVRPAALAGISYASDPSALHKEIESYLSFGSPQTSTRHSPIHGLMTPHIDYRRGHECYGKSFLYLEHESPEVVLLIGTSHQFSRNLFHLTLKNFDCPLGTLKNCTEFSKNLAQSYGEERAFMDEILHKQEHSLELQIPFLKRALPQAEIVPILVGSFHHLILNETLPSSYEPYETFVAALTQTIQDQILSRNRSLLVLAGVDMAHIGQYFGDKNRLSPDWLQNVQIRDHEYLNFLKNGDPIGLFGHIAEDQDARRVCGFPTMYTVIDLFQRLGWKTPGHLIHYQQAVNSQNDCAVTFAGMVF